MRRSRRLTLVSSSRTPCSWAGKRTPRTTRRTTSWEEEDETRQRETTVWPPSTARPLKTYTAVAFEVARQTRAVRCSRHPVEERDGVAVEAHPGRPVAERLRPELREEQLPEVERPGKAGTPWASVERPAGSRGPARPWCSARTAVIGLCSWTASTEPSEAFAARLRSFRPQPTARGPRPSGASISSCARKKEAMLNERITLFLHRIDCV